MNTALLVIDVQQILCSGNYRAFEIERVIERINAVARKARAAGAPVVVVQHETAGGGGMDHGTDGWKLAPALDTHHGDVSLRKTGSDAFHDTELQAVLQARDIDRLVVCGLQSEFCVDSTTRRALALGYPVTLVSDGHSTLDNGVLTAAQISAHHNQTLATLDSYGPRVTTVSAEDVRFDASAARMTPEIPVQLQLEAYNAHDLDRFVAQYADDVRVYRPPEINPVLSGKAAFAAHYAANRFNLPDLHADVVNRMVSGNKVVDHERITGLGAQPVEAIAVYEVIDDRIRTVWFFSPR